jgi:hypothetical protein
VPGLSVDKKQTNHQHKKQYRKAVSTGKHHPENQSAQRAQHGCGNNESEQHRRPDASHHQQERQQ